MTEELAELDARIAELEANGRWRDVASALERRAARSSGPDRVAFLLRALGVYRDRFNNHQLAIRVAEGVLEEDGDNEEAVRYLLEIYRKRRMQEKLAELEERLQRKQRGPYR